MDKRKSWAARYGIYLILFAGFLVRVWVIAQGTQIVHGRDDGEYFDLARTLVADISRYSDTFRPPVYPTFIATLWTLGGATWFPVGWVQALLDTATIALVYGLSRTLFHRTRVALLAALLCAFYPEWIALDRLYYSESLFIFLSTLAFGFLVQARRHFSFAVLFAAGVLMALAALTREVIGVFALSVTPVWLWLTARTLIRPSWFAPLVFLMGALGVIAPWVWRNYQLEQRFILISTSSEFSLVMHNARAVRTALGRTSERARTMINSTDLVRLDYFKKLRALDLARRAGYSLQRAIALISIAPRAWFQTKLIATSHVLRAPRLPQYVARLVDPRFKPSFRTFIQVYFVILVTLGLVGLVYASSDSAKVLFILYIAYTLALFFVTHLQYRYRLPLLTILVPYAALGLNVVAQSAWVVFTKHRMVLSRRSLVAACMTMVVLLSQRGILWR